jgi:hypothetical protein
VVLVPRSGGLTVKNVPSIRTVPHWMAVSRPTSVASQAEMKPGNTKGTEPKPTEQRRTNQTYRCCAQDATARAQQHGSELWSPVRDEEASGSNPITPTSATGR